MVVASGRLARIFTKNPLQHRARLQNDVFLYGSDHTVRDSQDIKGSREWSRYNMCNVCNVTVQPEKGLSKVSKAEFHILHWSFFIPLFRYEFFISSIEDHDILNGFACLPYIIFGFHSPIHFWSDFTQLRRLKERAFKLSGVSPQPALQAVAFKELAFSLL